MFRYARMILIPLVLLVFGLTVAAGAAPANLPATSPHGVLVDRVLPLAHLDRLDGSAGAPAAGFHRWRQALYELRRASEDPTGWPDPLDALSSVRAARAADRRIVPLGLIHAQYDRIEDGGSLTTGEILSVATLAEATYDGSDVRFVLAEPWLIDRGAGSLKALRLDPGDGGGMRPLVPGSPLAVSYARTGPKTLRLEADLTDGRTLQASTVLEVKALVTPDPTETWQITATESYGGAYGTGQAYVYLSDQHTTLTNPVVVSEGFDLDNSMDWPVLYELLNQQNLIEDLRADGFDAVVLDFTEATDPIQRNAFVLTALLQQVRDAIGPDRTMTLIGASMGGLVTRSALLWSEQQGIDHRVRTWVSFDSPQKGANIPLGLQEWLFFFKSESADAEYLLSRLDTPAAKQMLLYHHTNPALSPPGPAPEFDDFYGQLTDMGGWPATPHKVSIVNGSGQRADQGFAPGDQLIEYEYRSFLVDIDGNIWAVPDGGSQLIFKGMIEKIWPLPDRYKKITVEGTLPWDGAPGGYRASLAEMDTTAVDYGDIVALHDNHCFIPVISALALDVTDPFFDIAGAADLLSLTPFDEVHYPAENQEHVTITPESKPWFMNAVMRGVSGVAPRPVPQPSLISFGAPYPNPFNPRTRLTADLATGGVISLEIFDVRGRLVATLADGERLSAGPHQWQWDGREDGGGAAAAGIYQARLSGLGQVRVRTLTLVK